MNDFKEVDLYEPVKKYFEKLGYNVNGEVCKCDLTAVKDEHLIIVELKKTFSLKLLYQGIDRQKITEDVFVCIARPPKFTIEMQRNMIALIKKCGLGLIVVALDSPLKFVEVLIYPQTSTNTRKNKHRLKGLIDEINGRTIDTNVGGSTKTKINTAYRERAIKIACVLRNNGATSTKKLVETFGCASNCASLLNYNHYGWFEKVERGVYSLSKLGLAELENPDIAQFVAYYSDFNERD